MGETLNPETLESLRACADPGEPGFLAELVATYLSDSERRLAEMRGALLRGDAALLGRVAHTLKGSSLGVGADGFAALMHSLERSGKQGILPAPERLDEGEAEFARVKRALSDFLRQAG